jgi:hypothetical protein
MSNQLKTDQEEEKPTRMQKVFDFVKVHCLIYIIWIVLHYISSHLYVKWCVPSGIIGFMVSPFLTQSVHCRALRWGIATGAQTIQSMWAIIATWMTGKLLFT